MSQIPTQPLSQNAGVTVDRLNVTPVEAPQLPAVMPKAKLPAIKLPSFASVKRAWEATDFDGIRSDHGGHRTWATFNNGINAALAAGSVFPGISLVAGGCNIAWGGLKLVSSLFALIDAPNTDTSRGLAISGMKNIGLGATVFLMPGVLESLYIASAVKDTIDAGSASTKAS